MGVELRYTNYGAFDHFYGIYHAYLYLFPNSYKKLLRRELIA